MMASTHPNRDGTERQVAHDDSGRGRLGDHRPEPMGPTRIEKSGKLEDAIEALPNPPPRTQAMHGAFRKSFFSDVPTTVPGHNVHCEPGVVKGSANFFRSNVPGIVSIPQIDQWS